MFSTPSKSNKKSNKKHRQSCIHHNNMQSSPLLNDKVRLSKDDSTTLALKQVHSNVNHKTKKYQTLRQSELSSVLSKSMPSSNRHLQSTDFIRQMKEGAKASTRAMEKKMSVPRSPKHPASNAHRSQASSKLNNFKI